MILRGRTFRHRSNCGMQVRNTGKYAKKPTKKRAGSLSRPMRSLYSGSISMPLLCPPPLLQPAVLFSSGRPTSAAWAGMPSSFSRDGARPVHLPFSFSQRGVRPVHLPLPQLFLSVWLRLAVRPTCSRPAALLCQNTRSRSWCTVYPARHADSVLLPLHNSSNLLCL